MKTLVKTIVLSLSTTLITIPAMAAPQDHNPQHVDQRANPSYQQNHNAPQYNQRAEPNRQQTPNSPQYNQRAEPNRQQDHNSPQYSQHANLGHQQDRHDNPAHQRVNKPINPSRDWKVGQRLPSQYHGQGYKINHTKYKRLSKPARNQQWVKINGDYVLVNVLNHNIIKIISN